MVKDEYFDGREPAPLVSHASVRWVCGTVVLLVVIGLLAAFAWHRPDDAVRAAAVLWADLRSAAGTVGFVLIVILAILFLCVISA